MKKISAGLLLNLLSILVISSTALGSNILGPKKYVRTTGAPNVYTDTFHGTPGEGKLIIKNGEEDGTNRVTSALIFVNGQQLFSPDDFMKKVYTLELPLDFVSSNELVVELRSKPGTYLSIEVYQDPPSVSLTANPDTILLGESTTLTWNSHLADTCHITPAVGNVDLSGSTTVSPTETTTYTITATGAGGTTIAQATVTVIPPPTVNFSADPDTIIEGETTRLIWTTEDADTVIIDNGIGEKDVNGSVTISPTETTSYTITATGQGGTTTATVTVTVYHVPTVTLVASPDIIFYWETAILTWTSEHADACEIAPAVGAVSVNGSLAVSPTETTTYTITATGPGGTATAEAAVTVLPHHSFSAEEFEQGTFENIAPVDDHLELQSGVNTLPFIWVANSSEGTVSKIDTTTGQELGRYRTGPTTNTNPSRTTVDSEGNLWVGNRNTASATKIALYPRDKNHDGIIKTSTGKNNVLAWGQDEAVELYVTGVDSGPRALAVDAENNVWIGGYGNNMGYYNGQTGQKLKNIYIGRPCYGALIDGNGTLWISNKTSGLTRIDNPSETHKVKHISTNGGWVYGIAIDADGYIYASAYTHNRLRKLNPATNTWIYDVSISGGYQGRGVAVGMDGDVWVAHTGRNRVTRHNGANGSLKKTIYTQSGPTGVAVDSEGKIWVTNLSANSVQRINPATNTVDFTQGGHPGPYNYSDMTGYISRNITSQNGRWTVILDSEQEDTPWGIVSWDSYEPPGTRIRAKARTSMDQSAWSPWEDAASGVLIPNLPEGRYIEVEVTLTILEGEDSPLLYGLTISSALEGFANTPPEITSPAITDSDEGLSYVYPVVAVDNEDADLRFSLQVAPEGMAIDDATGLITWQLDAYKTGEYPVSVKVTDPAGAFDLQHYTLTVADTLECNNGEIRVCGISIGTCEMGEQVCANGAWDECQGAVGPQPEVCDGLDNNCSGLIDEDLTPPPADRQCGVCVGAVKVCGGDAGWQEPDYTGIDGYEAYETLADGLDNDCDCQVDVIKTLAPNVVGLARHSAEAAISAAQLTLGTVEKQYSLTVPEGQVISQSPAAGAVIDVGSSVDIVVSLGEPKIGVPNLTGRTQAEAEAMLSAADHLKVGGATEAYINTQPTGHVFLQQPAPGTLVSYDTAVDLFISLGLWTGVDETPPMVSLSVNPERVYLGEAVTIFAWAGDNVGVANQSLTINGNPVFATDNELVYTADAGGLYTVTLTAADAAGHTRTENKTFQVIDPNDTTPPAVSLNETDCIDVTDLYTVTGTVADPGGVSYQLFHREQGSNQWIYFAEGSGNTITGSLGVFDPTVLKNGVYEIALYAEDLLGNSASALGCALVDGGLKIGQVNLPTTDISLPDMGFPLSLEREYDSRNQGSGDFGPGWSLPASAVKPMVTKSLGGGWDQEARGGFFTTYYLIEKHRHFAVIRFSDTEMIKFKMDVNPKSSVLYPYGPHLPLTVSYQPLDGTQGTLQALDADPNVMMINNELREYGVELYQPTRFKYTRPDGTVYLISMQNGLESITDVYGHAISYDHNGIHHSSGVGITFERGAGDRIEKITDPFGRQVTYYYDAEGLLERVVQSGSEPYAMRVLNDYAYAQGVAARPVLKAIKAPDGTELGQFEYDSQGRVTGLIDANGHRVIYGYDVPNHRQEITDRLGNVTLYEYDDKGNVTSKTDALGGATQWAYDDRGNKLSETDPLGNTTSYTYDERDNLLTDTDPLGNTTTYTYNSRNQVSSITDPNGNTTTHTYDAKGDLLTTADPYGNLTTNTYDADGNLISTTDCRGNTATYEYDEYGNKIAEIDPLGHETAHTYDANGNQLTQTVTRTAESDPVTTVTTYQYDNKNQLIKTIDSNGFATVTEYNLLGKKAAEIDKNGSRTEYEYDGNANLTATIYPDGTTQVNTYDAEGNRIAATDLDGHTTTFEYDELKRLVRTIYSDGTETAMQYDAAGQLIATIDENGNPTEFEYDAAGRRTAVIDALGNVTTFAYDANGNQLRMTDANGHTPTFIYDKLNRRTKTTFPDGTFTETVYDCLGNKIAEIDQAGVTTQFEYDELGRLEAVIDALDGQTTYTYDEVGNKLTQTDPNGHVKTWAYDNLGRAIRHTLPLGQFETYGYDPNGNLIRKTDFNGDTTTYEYSTCCNSLLRKHFADGSQVSFNYTPTGQRETVTDARGVTAYSYDLRDRLTAVIHPDGTIVSYTYDAKGNRTSVSVPSGTTIYAFDELNRLITATAPNGGVTDYTYDSVGNRKSVSYPNGTMASYTYDSLNRLTYLENRKSSGELISSYSYTLGPAGNRTKAVENSGRTVEYTYDTLYRLVEEDITDPVLGNETINYTYDAFGNRLAKSDSTGTVNYTYGANDRLLSEIGAGLSHTYTYDNNGNTLTKSDGTNIIDYVYDYENRLTSVSAAGSLTESVYDADGIRVGKNVDGEITHYVVDKNSDYAQVLEETDGSGSLTVSYIYGDDLISQHRGETDRYYLYDGQMSTRQLQGATESVTDEYTYDAFGILLDQAGATVNNYLYTGEQYDPNAGFYYLRARYYNPNEGRFVTSDPFTGFELDPPTLHKYLYCSNNPSNRIDPSGEFSLSEVAVSLSVRATLFTLRHPLLATTIGLVTNALLPVEVHDAMMSSGLPGVSVLGETGQAQARVFRLIKSQRFRSFVKSNLSAAGTLWNVTGHEFERFARKYLFKGAIPGTKIIERTPDLIWKNFTIELKTGRNFGQREIRQLKEFSQHTGNLAYIFLIKPTKSTINKITKAGGKVFYIYDENGN